MKQTLNRNYKYETCGKVIRSTQQLNDAIIRGLHIKRQNKETKQREYYFQGEWRIYWEIYSAKPEPKARLPRRKRCAECGIGWADEPSNLCPCCEAYQDHANPY